MQTPQEAPSGYLIDQARKEADAARLNQSSADIEEATTARDELVSSIVEDALSNNETQCADPEKAEPGFAAFLSDPTLTDLERMLAKRSERMLRFCWEVAREYADGPKHGWKARSAVAVGINPKHASKRAEEYLQDAMVKRVIQERAPVAFAAKGVSKDKNAAILSKIIDRSMQEVAVKGRDGKPTGYFVADHAMALRCIQELNNMNGYYIKPAVEKASQSDPSGNPTNDGSSEVSLDIDVGGVAKRVSGALIDGLKGE